MTLPDGAALFQALEATWPSASTRRAGALTLRDGAGGGKRVSAATTIGGTVGSDDLAAAEAAMRGWGQAPLFRIGPKDDTFDSLLAAQGYAACDHTLFYAAPVAALAAPPAPVTLFTIWPPLQIIRDIWSERGIGTSRQEVMARAADPKTAFVARASDRAAGAAFAACHGQIAMLHAVEVLPGLRRKGAARTMVTGAAWWAQRQGMHWLALAVTRDNAPARALYAALGMQQCCGYHYRTLAR